MNLIDLNKKLKEKYGINESNSFKSIKEELYKIEENKHNK